MKVKQPQAFRSLRVTLSIAFLLFNFAILLTAIGFGAYFNFTVEKELIINQQNLIAKDSAHIVQNFIQKKIDLLKLTASLGNLLSTPAENRNLVLTKALSADPSFHQMILLDTTGQEMTRVSRTSDIASKKINEHLEIAEILTKTKDQAKEYFSPVYVYETTSEPMMIIAVPLRDVFKDFSGVLLAEVNLKFTWDIIDQLEVGNGGAAYVVDRQGKLIAFKDTGRVLKNENLSNLDEVKEFIANENSFDESSAKFSRGIYGTYVTATHVPLQQPDWAVVVETSFIESYASMIRLLEFDLLLVFLGLIIIWFGGSYLSNKIARPIIVLRDAAAKISQGNLDTKIDTGSRNEIGQLSEAFNEMATKLKDSYSILEKKVRERTLELEKERGSLEQKVRERTLELEKIKAGLEKSVSERTLELQKAKVGLEKTVAERTAELESRLLELKKLNNIMIDRELKMMELKKKIKEAQGK